MQFLKDGVQTVINVTRLVKHTFLFKVKNHKNRGA